MWLNLYGLPESIKYRKTLKLCKHCGLLHKKQLVECPKCTDVDDNELEVLLQQNTRFRIDLGKTMLYGTAAFFVLIIVINGLE